MLTSNAERRFRGRIWGNRAIRGEEKGSNITPRENVPRNRFGKRQRGGGGGWGGRGGWSGGGDGGWEGGWEGGWGGQPGEVTTITRTQPQQTQTQTVIVTTGNTPTTRVVVTTQQPTTQVVVVTQPLPPPSDRSPTNSGSPEPPASHNSLAPSNSPGLGGGPVAGPSRTIVTGTQGQSSNIISPRPSQITDSRGVSSGSGTNTLDSGSQTMSGSAPSMGIDTPPNNGGNGGNWDTSANTTQESRVPVGAIVGSVLGGIILILLALLLWLCLLRRLRRQARLAARAYPFHGAAQGNSTGNALDATAVSTEPQADPPMAARVPPTLPPILTKGALFASRPNSPTSPSDLSSNAHQQPLDREEVTRAIQTLQALSPTSEHPSGGDQRIAEAIETLQALLGRNRNTMSDFGSFIPVNFNPPPAYQESSSRLSRQQRDGRDRYSSNISV